MSHWIKTISVAPKACFVTFGLNLSYFACAPGHGSIWAGIPSELEDKLRKSFDTPCCVSLGVHNAWFMLWPDGTCTWKFNGHYSVLEKILTEAAPRSVSVSNAVQFRGRRTHGDISTSLSHRTTNNTTSSPFGTSPSNTTSQGLRQSG